MTSPLKEPLMERHDTPCKEWWATCVSRFKGRESSSPMGEMQVAGEFLKSSSSWASIKLRGHEGLRSGAGPGAAQEEGRPESQKPHLHHFVFPGNCSFSYTPQETHTSQWRNHTFLPQGKMEYFSFCFFLFFLCLEWKGTLFADGA